MKNTENKNNVSKFAAAMREYETAVAAQTAAERTAAQLEALATDPTNDMQTADRLKHITAAKQTRREAESRTAAALETLAEAVAMSVLKKVIDPQSKAAQTTDKVSNSGYNPALVAMKAEVKRDRAALRNILEAETAAALVGDTIGDGSDLVQTAAAAILEATAQHRADGENWLESTYTRRTLDKRVVIRDSESPAWKDIETSAIREAFRAVRQAVADSRAMQTDPRNGYTYLEEMSEGGETGALEVYYRRMHKYADLGGYAVDFNGAQTFYTADRETVDKTAATIAALNLSAQQAQILRYRMSGYGVKAIAARMGVKVQSVQAQLKRVQAKYTALTGYTPAAQTTDK